MTEQFEPPSETAYGDDEETEVTVIEIDSDLDD
jgi:hypothetical protein